MVKNTPPSAGDVRESAVFDPWGRKIPWKRHGELLQYSCLENPTERGAWQAMVHGVVQSLTQLKELSVCTLTHSEYTYLKSVFEQLHYLDSLWIYFFPVFPLVFV